MDQTSDVRTHPKVSTIIPCWNAKAHLADAIRSVLDQGHRALEILVADDGSTDDSRDIAASFGESVRVLPGPHLGAAAARNRGVSAANGEILAFLDADDLWTEGRLALQLRALEADPTLDMVVGRTVQFVSPEVPEPERSRFAFDPGPSAARLSGTAIVRATSFHRVGLFATRLATGEFMDWFARAEEVGLRSVMLDDVVLRRRLHGANHGIVRRDARKDYMNVLKAALDRRRAAQEQRG